MSSTKSVYFGPIGKKQDGRPGLWLAEIFFDFFFETADQNSTKLDRKQGLNVLYQFPGWSEKQDDRPGLWFGWNIFDFSSETAEQNSTKLDRKQDLNVCLCFSGRSEKQDDRPGLWLAETFSTSPLKPLNGIQRNLTGSKISMLFTKFVFSGRSEKQDGRPSFWMTETCSTSDLRLQTSDFSSETTEWNSTKSYWKQDLNILYWVCVFHADEYTKMAALADP